MTKRKEKAYEAIKTPLPISRRFLWGSSTSGPQSEGTVSGDGKGPSNWDYWFSLEPDKFHHQIGPEVTSTFYTNYKSDIALLKETGHTAFRTSIQWSRLIPEGVGQVNPKAVAFYREVFQEIMAQDIKLIVNLYHFDLPYALQEKGGWEAKETVWAYETYAKTCFELLVIWWIHGLPLTNLLFQSNAVIWGITTILAR